MKDKNQGIRVFVTREIPLSGIDLLRSEGFSVSVWQEDRPMTTDEMIAEGKKANAFITLSTDPIDAAFLNACSHLDIISQFAAGYDNIDIREATRLGIPIGNAPGAMSEATADIAFGLMIAVSRKFFFMHKTIGKGEWNFFRPMANLGFELKGKTLGIVGLGRIGFEMAKRCKGAYEMEIIYHNRNSNRDAEKILAAKRVGLDELLSRSDIVSVHCALNQETKGLFNASAFSKMKSTAIFINTARGPIHVEEDLLEALYTGKIWGAGLDVTNPEPMKSNNPLLEMENVAILPHIGSATIEARSEMSRLAALNVVEFYKDGKVKNLVNGEGLKVGGKNL